MHKIFTLITGVLIIGCTTAQDITQQLDNYLSKPQKKNAFNGTALVVQHGNILLYKGYGFKNIITKTLNDTGTIYRIGSLTKPFTAAVILRLIEQHALSLQDPLSKFLPGYPHGDSITIEHLLTHTSGVKEYLQIEVIQNLPDSAPPIALEKLISYFSHEALTIQPGKKFAYSNSNYILLAAIIEKITGEKYEQVVRRCIFEPAAMQHSGFDFKHVKDSSKATGHPNMRNNSIVGEDFDSSWAPGCGAMYSTVMDIYKWYRALYNGKVIQDSTRELAFVRRKGDYGYGWINEKKQGRTCISHAGGVPGFLANLQFYPREDLCVILLSNDSLRDIFIDSDQLAKMVLKDRNRISHSLLPPPTPW